ncbi:hypothetical protein LPJ66_000714 [Kickxella alabastrina]|uniref:Uncharacterized protein n=1 Tax=Kickxella alabastrina TaxID=61397 RepID=A0ACC1IVK6_9FUNG|nr:hypothetical protein LPJ66_000714 [Kickxella alabastrina]
MRSLLPSVLALLLGALLPAHASADTLEVFHNLAPNKFTQRGELTLTDPPAYSPIISDGFPPPTLPDTDAWAQQGDRSQYAVVLRSQKTGSLVHLAAPRCRLNGAARPKEVFVVHAERNGALLHVDYAVGSLENCHSRTLVDVDGFDTQVVVRRRMQGPTPELAAAVSIDANTGSEKAPEVQKSFIMKYWYYIVPIVLMLLLTGEDAPQQEGTARR